MLLLTLFLPALSYADKPSDDDEISVSLNVQGIGTTEIPVVIRSDVVYLSIIDVFNFLKIKNNPSSGLDSVSGFFVNIESAYLVDRVHHRIMYQNKVIDLKPDDLIRSETNLYLKSDYFGEVFGLDCVFNFRRLSITLNTKLDLPTIREMRQELIRKNVNRLKGATKADTTISRKYPLFAFGMADWSVNTIEQIRGGNDSRLNLGLGATLAGGETKILINYNNNEPFTGRQQYYSWRFVNNENQAFRQITGGIIAS